jgi:hypothetical protein
MKKDAMVNDPAGTDVRALWQSQQPDGGRMSASDVHRHSEELQKKARRRLMGMYIIGAANAGLPVILMWFLPELRLGLGYLAVTAAILVFYVRRRTIVRPISPEMTVSDGRAFYRHLLERERDFRRNSARWFTIGPGLNIIVLTSVYVSSSLFHGAPAELAVIAAVLLAHVVVLTGVSMKLTAEATRYQSELEKM